MNRWAILTSPYRAEGRHVLSLIHYAGTRFVHLASALFFRLKTIH